MKGDVLASEFTEEKTINFNLLIQHYTACALFMMPTKNRNGIPVTI
jgi:hypothetical protein